MTEKTITPASTPNEFEAAALLRALRDAGSQLLSR